METKSPGRSSARAARGAVPAGTACLQGQGAGSSSTCSRAGCRQPSGENLSHQVGTTSTAMRTDVPTLQESREQAGPAPTRAHGGCLRTASGAPTAPSLGTTRRRARWHRPELAVRCSHSSMGPCGSQASSLAAPPRAAPTGSHIARRFCLPHGWVSFATAAGTPLLCMQVRLCTHSKAHRGT